MDGSNWVKSNQGEAPAAKNVLARHARQYLTTGKDIAGNDCAVERLLISHLFSLNINNLLVTLTFNTTTSTSSFFFLPVVFFHLFF